MRKKRIVIAGAGQMGFAAAQLLNPNKTELLGFADNDPSKWTHPDGSFVDPTDPADPADPTDPTDPAEYNKADTLPKSCKGITNNAVKTGQAADSMLTRPGYEAGGIEPQIFSMDTAINLEPDEIIISVMGDERIRDLTEQLRICRFYGELTYLKNLYDDFDIRSRSLKLAAARIREMNIPGDMAELGVYKGDTAWQMNGLMPDRTLYLFDTFEGFDERDVDIEKEDAISGAKAGDFSDTDEQAVMNRMPFPQKVVIKKGFFPESAAGMDDCRFALVSLDPDLYAPALEGLRFFYPRMSEGGMIIVHDYNNTRFGGIQKAVREFEAELASGMNDLRIWKQDEAVAGAEQEKNASLKRRWHRDRIEKRQESQESYKGEQTAKVGRLKIVPLADLHGTCVIIK